MSGTPAQMLYVAQVGRERTEARHEAVLTVLLAALTVSLLWATLLRRRVDRTLRPLVRLTRQIEAYDPLQPATEPDPGQRAETAAISEAVRALGRRVAQQVRQEQAFSACAAHSLRTPLAGMDAQLALAQREGGSPQRLGRVRAALTRLTRVVQSLLTLFRAGEHWQLELRPCRLSALVTEIPVEGLTVVVEGDADFIADPTLVTIALVNLLDNAARFNAQHVWLHAAPREGSLRVCMRDDGMGIGEARWREVSRALQAVGDTPGPDVHHGLGLGLRLAALVAEAHGGQLSLPAPLPGRAGFYVELRLSLDPARAPRRAALAAGDAQAEHGS
jgi:signal transduction histidine kinase